MIAFACWTLIYIARGLEWTRLHWNEVFIGEHGLLARWAWIPSPRCSNMVRLTRAGIVVDRACHWMRPLAVWLTRLANRGLPPIPEDSGFLCRLYP